MRKQAAFTLIELLVVVAILGIVAAMLFAVVGNAKEKARRVACANNLRQVNAALQMYCDDSRDVTPIASGPNDPTYSLVAYKRLVNDYVSNRAITAVRNESRHQIFACPADRFYYDEVMSMARLVAHGLCEQSISDHSSYTFNGGDPGIAGMRLSSIQEPCKTVLVGEASACVPWSRHQPKRPLSHENAKFNNARNLISFVDSHVSYIRIHWDENRSGLAINYDPPAGYEYRWSGK